MMRRHAQLSATAVVLAVAAALGAPPPQRAGAEDAAAIPAGKGTVELVDGVKTDCEVLFRHPNASRLVVRSSANSTAQTLDIGQVHAVTVDGRTVTLSPRRPLTPEEKRLRETNRLWGDEAGAGQIGRYAKQRWPAKPLFVWAHPGKGGAFDKAENWLDETGKVCAASPWRKDTVEQRQQRDRRGRAGPETGELDGDVLLPAAEAQYAVDQPGNRDHLGAFRVRHLTVEANASYDVRYAIRGNLWMKNASMLGRGTQTGGFGSGESGWNTFARFCGRRWIDQKSAQRKRPGGAGESDWIAISHWVWMDTGEAGSLEVIGASGGAGDRLTLQRGTLIVAEDSYIGNGNRGCFYSMPGTTTILLDGAGVGCRHKVISRGRATYGIAGTLMFGTPEHPLRRDLRFPGCLFNPEDLMPSPSLGQRTGGASFVVGESGRIVIHSKDPKTARVVFCPVPAANPFSQYVMPPYAKGREMPKGVTAVFAGKTDFDGIVFEGFYEHGVLVAPEDRARWRHVFFGDNLAEPAGLFAPLPAEPARTDEEQ